MENHNLEEGENIVPSSKSQNVKLNVESLTDCSGNMDAGTRTSRDPNSTLNSETAPKGNSMKLNQFRKSSEKTFTQRCRLFVGNLPMDITEEELKKLFFKYGEANEVFINRDRGFGFIRLVRLCNRKSSRIVFFIYL